MKINDFYFDNIDNSSNNSSNKLDDVVETTVFVKLENQMSCSEEDSFYLCVNNVSNIDKYKDIDGFYKIDVTFIDGKVIQFEYFSEDELEKNYKKLLKYFKNENNSGQEIEDADSDYYFSKF